MRARACSVTIYFFCTVCLSAEQPTQNALPEAVPDQPGAVSEFSRAQEVYVGRFNEERITISLEKVTEKTVDGFSVYKANVRPFHGTIAHEKGKVTMVLTEPGDDPDDGVFKLVLDSTRLEGVWAPNDRRLRPANIAVERTDFHYNPALGKYPETSTKVLKTKDVQNLKSDVLRIMRNEIYARHGYCFQLQDMRNYFLAQPWYVPVSTNVQEELTKIELHNADLIRRYERYNADYYDRFGR